MLRGTLDEFSLADIVGFIGRAGKTGVLELSGAAGSGHIYFREGAVCGVRCARGREPLGRKLVRAHVLTEVQLQEAIARQSRARLRLGKALIAEGLALQSEVDAALREQVEESVVGLMGLQPSEFTWRAATPEESTVAIDAESFLRSVNARLEQLEAIRQRIPSDDLTVTMNPVPPQGAVTVTEEEWRVLAMLGVRRSVRDLVQYSGAGDFHALKTVDHLLNSGLLEIVGRPPPSPPEVAVKPPPKAPPPPIPPGVQVSGVPRRRVIRLAEAEADEGAFKIAVVSTSDRTRGPLAVALLRKATAELPVVISSFGTEDTAGAPPTVEATLAGQQLGVDLVEHRSTLLTPGALAGFDLVLGFEWDHVHEAVTTGGAKRPAAFTVLELLTLLGSIPAGGLEAVERARLVVERAHRSRAGTPPRGELQLDVPPIGSAVSDMAKFIHEACVRIRAALFGPASVRDVR